MSDFEPKPFGKYFLIEKVAVGGMAEIYKAKTFGVDGFEKMLAIKKILPNYSSDKEFIAMLTDEAKLVVRLSHTNIVQIFDLGKIGEDYYISMEYIDGINMREVLARARELGQKVPLPLCLYIISEVCKGLDYAHSKRDDQGQPLHIVHRDISPHNILISFEGEPKIVDFGIAKAALNATHTSAGILKGKITYMSPEQALGKPIDGRTDVFSAGLLLYELITGERFFTGESQMEILQKIRSAPITEETLRSKVPNEAVAVLAKALAFVPKNRLQTAGDFQIALTKMLYSRYSDFSPKQLAQLIQHWFSDELKDRKRKVQDESSVGSSVRQSMQAGKAQKILVEKSISKKIKGQVFQDTTMPDSEHLPEHFGDGPEIMRPETTVSEVTVAPDNPVILPKKVGKLRLVLITLLLVLVLLAAFFWLSKKEVVSPGPEEREIPVSLDTLKPAEKIAPPVAAKSKPEKKILGTLRIHSQPQGAFIFVDDRDTGEITPFEMNQIEVPHAYKISLRKKNYADETRTVEISGTDPVMLDMVLTVRPEFQSGRLEVTTNVPGALVSINGDMAGSAPETLQLKPGTYRIGLSADGFLTQDKTVDVGTGEFKSLAFRLEPVPAPAPSLPEPAKPEPPAALPKNKAMPSEAKKNEVNQESDPEKQGTRPGEAGTVRIDSSPRGAGVTFDGNKSGITPTIISQVARGSSHIITLELPGYRGWTKTFTMGQNHLEFQATLQEGTQ